MKSLDFTYYFKIYNTDVALNSIRCIDNRYDLTHNLENIIYNELVYMDYNVTVYNNNGREIDFLAQKHNKKYLYNKRTVFRRNIKTNKSRK